MTVHTIQNNKSALSIVATSYDQNTKTGCLTLANGEKYKLTFKNIDESKLQENLEKVAQNIVSMLQTKGLLQERSFNQATINSKGIKTSSSFFSHDDIPRTRNLYQELTSLVTHNYKETRIIEYPSPLNTSNQNQAVPQKEDIFLPRFLYKPLALNEREVQKQDSNQVTTIIKYQENNPFPFTELKDLKKVDDFPLSIRKILLTALPILTIIGVLSVFIYTDPFDKDATASNPLLPPGPLSEYDLNPNNFIPLLPASSSAQPTANPMLPALYLKQICNISAKDGFLHFLSSVGECVSNLFQYLYKG